MTSLVYGMEDLLPDVLWIGHFSRTISSPPTVYDSVFIIFYLSNQKVTDIIFMASDKMSPEALLSLVFIHVPGAEYKPQSPAFISL